MKMKNFFLSVIALTSVFYGHAQISNASDNGGSPIRITKYDRVEGSPFLNDGNWSAGTVITQTDKYLTNLKLRYNAFEDELQYLNKNVPFYYANQDVKSFEFSIADPLGNTERFLFKNGFEFEDDIKKVDYLRVHYNGKSVKALERIQARKQKVTPASYGESDYDQFVLTNKTYIWVNGKMSEVGFKKAKVIKAFPSLKSKLQSYFKENIVDFSSSKDISDLFEFIDSALE